MLNRQNLRRWEPRNPHWRFQLNANERWSVMVWAGVMGHRLIGPYIFRENVNGQNYEEFLRNILPILLDEAGVPDNLIDRMWWMQDGAPAHRAAIVGEFLNELFED